MIGFAYDPHMAALWAGEDILANSNTRGEHISAGEVFLFAMIALLGGLALALI